MNERGPLDHQPLRGRVPGHRPVLPARRRRLSTRPAALGHGDLAAEDAGRQVRLVGVEDGPQVRGHDRDAARAAQMPAGQRRPRRGHASHWSQRSVVSRSRRQKNAVLRDREPVPATARRKELIHRLLAGRCELCGQADQVRCTRSASSQISTSPDSQTNPNGCRIMAKRRRKTLVVCASLPRQHPPREANRVNHGIVAGEPGDRKRSRRVREGGVGKGPARAPRRRPTSPPSGCCSRSPPSRPASSRASWTSTTSTRS